MFAECDVLSPCALGAVFTPDTIPRLRCRAIAGAANNQLGTIDDGDALAARGIAYAPDFVVSAGGIINIAGEFGGYDAERQRERTRGIEQTVGGSSRWPASAASPPPAPPRRWPASASPPSPRSPAAGGPATARPGRRAAASRGSAARDPAAGQRRHAAAADHHLADHPRERGGVRVLDRPARPDAAPVRPRRTVAISGFDAITLEYGFTPCEVESECDRPNYGETLKAGSDDTADTAQVRVDRAPVWITLLSAMFMHGGWLHLIGNMLFLFVFGNNVEDAMSRSAFLLFYLLGGLAARSRSSPSIRPPRCRTSVPAGRSPASSAATSCCTRGPSPDGGARYCVFVYLAELPAVLVLLTWFGLQVLDGSAGLVNPDASFGVAYFAHIGGFVAGFLLVRLFAWPTRVRRRRGDVRYA